jgi:acyl carrier protein
MQTTVDMDIADLIRAFISANFYVEPDALADDASLLEQGIVDSTGVLEVVAFLETEFGIEVRDEDLLPQNLDTVAAITGYVARKRAAAA